MTVILTIKEAEKRHSDLKRGQHWLGANKIYVFTCPIHGDYTQRYNHHNSGSGCSNCHDIRRRKLRLPKSLPGYKFGELIATGNIKNVTGARYEVECKHGNRKFIRANKLISGWSTSCRLWLECPQKCPHGSGNYQGCVKCRGTLATFHSAAHCGKSALKNFLRLLGLGKDYNPIDLISNFKISNEKLEKVSNGNGYPDFEGIEEKGPKTDFLSINQWARSVLYYRQNKDFRVRWRFNINDFLEFNNVFDFYEWQQRLGIDVN